MAACMFSRGEWSLWSRARSDWVCTRNGFPTPGCPTSCPYLYRGATHTRGGLGQ
jgi:hypothetical protein